MIDLDTIATEASDVSKSLLSADLIMLGKFLGRLFMVAHSELLSVRNLLAVHSVSRRRASPGAIFRSLCRLEQKLAQSVLMRYHSWEFFAHDNQGNFPAASSMGAACRGSLRCRWQLLSSLCSRW
ncbi:hypothetical protein [Rhizobium sp. BK650]|uniref:hypothetical protein n=1 Tax=Rhizobium sp. BK650 TaxID=2586990 RepID=UPI00161C821E|nr:hypothetical protein [Rhizobium sp. BK650]